MKVVYLRGDRLVAGETRALSRDDGAVAAIGTDDGRWLLVDAGEAVVEQLRGPPASALPATLWNSARRGVVLTEARDESIAGLPALRRDGAVEIYATPLVFERVAPTLPLRPPGGTVHWRPIPIGGDVCVVPFRVAGMAGFDFVALAVPPLDADGGEGCTGDAIAVVVHDLATGQRVVCAQGAARHATASGPAGAAVA